MSLSDGCLSCTWELPIRSLSDIGLFNVCTCELPIRSSSDGGLFDVVLLISSVAGQAPCACRDASLCNQVLFVCELCGSVRFSERD